MDEWKGLVCSTLMFNTQSGLIPQEWSLALIPCAHIASYTKRQILGCSPCIRTRVQQRRFPALREFLSSVFIVGSELRGHLLPHPPHPNSGRLRQMLMPNMGQSLVPNLS